MTVRDSERAAWSPLPDAEVIDVDLGGAHAVASHSDTTATGAELETLTDGSDADALHAHPALGGSWGTWSPSYANLTIGNGTVVARKVQIGKTVHAYWSLVLGSTSSVGTAPTVSTPVTASSSYLTGQQIGMAQFDDAGTFHQGTAVLASTTTIEIIGYDLGIGGSERIIQKTLSSVSPFTWTTGDSISFAVTFEAA